jgi:putative membrane protein
MICWSDWHREPLIVYALVFAGWLYAIAAWPLRQVLAPGSPSCPREAVRFYAALALCWAAVSSPLDQVGRVFLFSAGMAQHLILIYPVAVLLLRGVPPWMADWALDRPALRRPLRWVLNPVAGVGLFILVVGLWHLPRLYESALQDVRLQQVENLMFLAVALLFWWPLLSPSRVFPRAGLGIQALYLGFAQVSLTALFTYLFMADHALYPTYQYAPRLVDVLPPLEDQRLAGILLGVVSSLVLVGGLGATFFKWAHLPEQPQSQR